MAIGEAYIIGRNHFVNIKKITVQNPKQEIDKLQQALMVAEKKLTELKEKMSGILEDEELAIYDAHIGILQDPELIDKTITQIKSECINASFALYAVANEFISELQQIEDEYIRSRIKDIEEVTGTVIELLEGISNNMERPEKQVIIVSQKLTTHQLSSLDSNLILGIITAHGGPTDHTAIISKAMGIPLIVGINEQLDSISHQTTLIVDADEGFIHVNPDHEIIDQYNDKIHSLAQLRKSNIENSQHPAITRSGKIIKVYANIGSTMEAKAALQQGADGIGLLRTEICFMNCNSLPSEEEQFLIYKEIMEALPGKEIVIRLLDIGSDKKLPYLEIPAEDNPAMGSRALRLGFEQYEELLKPQLRAILRLLTLFDIQILCPMIATPDDLRKIKDAIQQEQSSLEQEGFYISKKIQLGIMVEIPNVALMPELFVDDADFFSFGTNDLAQYLMAADRTNTSVVDYIPKAIPGILKLIENVCRVAHQKGKWVGICGELASEKSLIKQFINMGVEELSMPPSMIPQVKALIRELE